MQANIRRTKLAVLIFLCAIVFIAARFAGAQESTWSGVDESVVQKVAAEHGRTAWKPFINTDQGDMLLFVFLLAGTAGGFLIGYNFRKLFGDKKK
jgi:ABC-type cobalt transport system substrate-binding protein